MIDRPTETAVVELPEPEIQETARGDWLGWVPWVLSLAFVGLSLVLLGFGSKLRKENNELAQRLADTEYAYSELQTQQTNLQRKLTRVETNYATRVADLQKQVVQKNQDAERHKLEIETRTADANQARKKIGQLQNQIAQNTAEMDRLSQQVAGGVNSLDQDNSSQTRMGLLMPTPDGPPGAAASAVFNIRDQKGTLTAENLAPLPPDRDYQLWLMDPSAPGPVSGGVFRVNERGAAQIEYKPAAQLQSPDRFGISVERKGGAAAPSARFVLVSH